MEMLSAGLAGISPSSPGVYINFDRRKPIIFPDFVQVI